MQQNHADESRQEALRTEYSEVLNNFRMLTDIRFKLLAFLPIAAAVAAALSKESPNKVGLAIPLFGLVATIGLATYNARNDQLYNELVGRAAAIERSLHIPDGAFANRPTAWLRITLLGRKWKIDHGTAISTIYAASIALWLFGVVTYVLDVSVQNTSAWVTLVAIVIAIILTYLGGRLIRGQRKSRQKEMRELARRATNKAVGLPLPQAVSDQGFIKICARLSDSAEREVRARAKYYAITDREWAKSHVLHGSEKLTASQLIALLTDLPPLWIYDCYTNRKGLLREDRPVNIARRGGAGIAPENTLEGFRKSLRAGAEHLNLDVHITHDGHVVVIHDPTVDRTTNGTGAVQKMSLPELKELDAGYWFSTDGHRTHPYRHQGVRVPTLQEVYREFIEVPINVEIKADLPDIEQEVLRVIEEAGAEDRTLVVSEKTAVIRRFRKASDGQVATASSAKERGRFYVLSLLRLSRLLRPPYQALQGPEFYRGLRVVTPGFVEAGHELGLQVNVWTIDAEPDMCRLLGFGVDSILTDRPGVLAEVLSGGQ